MKTKLKMSAFLFALCLGNLVSFVHAQADLTLKPGVSVSQQHQWTLFVERHAVSIYDSLGEKVDSVNTGDRRIISISADKNGNFIANCFGDAEFSRVAIYYSKTGTELWRYNYSYEDNDAGLQLSPEGAYAVLSKCSPSSFALISTFDTTKKLKQPIGGLDSSAILWSQFAGDGTLLIIVRQKMQAGILYNYNYNTEKIIDQKELKNSTGASFRNYGEAIICNANRTLFAMLLIDAKDTAAGLTALANPNWVLIFDKNLNMQILQNGNERIRTIQLLDSIAITTSMDRKTSRLFCSIYRNQNSQKEIIDSNLATEDISMPFQSNSDIFFYIAGQKRNVGKYNLAKRQLTKGEPGIPIFKPKADKQKKALFLNIHD